jgi:hypothetical protein
MAVINHFFRASKYIARFALRTSRQRAKKNFQARDFISAKSV